MGELGALVQKQLHQLKEQLRSPLHQATPANESKKEILDFL